MIIGRKLNEVLEFNSEHTYFFHQGNWYHHLKKFPGVLADLNGYVRFESKEEYINHPNLKHGQRLHVKNGIKSIDNYIEFNEEQLYILNQIINQNLAKNSSSEDNSRVERKPINIDTIIRNQSFVRKVKDLHDNTCQICDIKLKIGPTSYYSEVHHIKPLGKPHNGPDIMSNMVCVCPNCHTKLDYGFIKIEVDLNKSPNHRIDNQFVKYHNKRVVKNTRTTPQNPPPKNQ